MQILFLLVVLTQSVHSRSEEDSNKIKYEYEKEVSLNIDFETATFLLTHFDLTKSIREDFYINIFEKGNFRMDNHGFRLKNFPDKHKKILQVSEKTVIKYTSCDNYTLKLTEKRKYNKKTTSISARTLLDSFNRLQKDISAGDITDFNVGFFQHAVEKINHEAKTLLYHFKNNKNLWIPVKRTLHKKYTKKRYISDMMIKIKVGISEDYIGSKPVSTRYDLEFSTHNKGVSADKLMNYACKILTADKSLPIRQRPANKDAESFTLAKMRNR